MLQKKGVLSFLMFLFCTATVIAQNNQKLINDALKLLSGTASFEVWKYDGTKLLQQNAIPAAKPGEGSLKTTTASWKYNITSLQQMKAGALNSLFSTKWK